MKELRETIHNANLTKTQKMIAKYILDNSADACFMTSTEIALKLGVSESSVVRFSRLRYSALSSNFARLAMRGGNGDAAGDT